MKDVDKPCSVTFAQAKQLMDSGDAFVFADVRTEEEFALEHAAGAVLFPLDDIDEETANALIHAKDTAILVYCRTGQRSKLAAKKLVSLGFTKVYDVGSLAGWPYGRDFGL